MRASWERPPRPYFRSKRVGASMGRLVAHLWATVSGGVPTYREPSGPSRTKLSFVGMAHPGLAGGGTPDADDLLVVRPELHTRHDRRWRRHGRRGWTHTGRGGRPEALQRWRKRLRKRRERAGGPPMIGQMSDEAVPRCPETDRDYRRRRSRRYRPRLGVGHEVCSPATARVLQLARSPVRLHQFGEAMGFVEQLPR